MTTNTDIVACARGWLGTRFHHQGRLKKTATHKGGVDCLGLLAGIASELDLRLPDGKPIHALDETTYSHYPDTNYLQQKLLLALAPVSVDLLEPGHVLLLTIDSQPQHMGIVSDMLGGLGLIHAYAPARAVVEHALDTHWQQRIVAAYRLTA